MFVAVRFRKGKPLLATKIIGKNCEEAINNLLTALPVGVIKREGKVIQVVSGWQTGTYILYELPRRTTRFLILTIQNNTVTQVEQLGHHSFTAAHAAVKIKLTNRGEKPSGISPLVVGEREYHLIRVLPQFPS